MITQKQRRTEKGLCFKHYYKWILCFSLTLYFVASFFVDHDQDDHPSSSSSSLSPSNPLITNPKPKLLASHAMFESKIHDKRLSFRLQRPNIRTDVFNNLKIYVYDLPSKFNTDWLANDRCSNHLFAAEVALHKALLSLDGDVRTQDPYEADFFFVPVYVSCNFSTVNGFPAIGHARPLIKEAIDLISAQYPFWNRTSGSDHVFTATHDFGSCFHTIEDRAVADGVPRMLRNSIVLQTFGVTYKHPCQEVENVVIPPYISPESLRKTLKNIPAAQERDIRVFFRGKMEIHPKNVSGRFYSKRIRTEIWRRYGGDRRFYLQRQRFTGYQSEIARSVFCLCPLGWAPWSPRLVESVALGCVPVIIADGIRLPFPSAVRWPDISLTVAERDVGKLGGILEHVAATNLSDIQKNLEDTSVRRALLFNVPPREGDCNIPGPAQNGTRELQAQESETLLQSPPISYKRDITPRVSPQERQQAKPCPTRTSPPPPIVDDQPPPPVTAARSPATDRPARSPSRRSRAPSRRLLDSFSCNLLRSEPQDPER